ncbi:hypothetical protein GOBAR_DD04796 [Gossypium barbadense]|nr:hypothetical protein GOBAR_DD04796 [Gossypium barbadense]
MDEQDLEQNVLGKLLNYYVKLKGFVELSCEGKGGEDEKWVIFGDFDQVLNQVDKYASSHQNLKCCKAPKKLEEEMTKLQGNIHEKIKQRKELETLLEQ